jgi:hypothetical protein
MSSKTTIELGRFDPNNIIRAYYDTKQLRHGRSSLENPRLANFMINGLSCVKCGIKGNTFISERQPEQLRPHFNLYMVNEHSKILITRDHIKPRSWGGINCIHNYQPMCGRCNRKKSDGYGIKDRIKHLTSFIKYKFRNPRRHIEECNCSLLKALR